MLLHHYKTNFLIWLMLLFAVLGCALVVIGVGLPLLLQPEMDFGMWLSTGLGMLLGLGLPLGALALWLIVPAIITRYDQARRMVTVEYVRPLSRKVAEYPVADIADVGLMSTGTRTFSLAFTLRDGERVRIDYGATSDRSQLQAKAAAIRQALGVRPTSLVQI
ncbi:MAG: hypothetical protein IT317_19380 [Anaerolineales bacterium]|nr:hypothetical protein [Anaerolineales bacterium]